MTAALIQFDENLAPDLLSKNYVLLRLLIKCGSYKSAATNTVFTVFCLCIVSRKEICRISYQQVSETL